MQPESASMKKHARGSAQFVCRILIVDGDRNRSDHTVLLAEHMGHQVRRAYRGVTAIDIAKQFLPDIVLIDFAQGDVGLALAAAIRRMSTGRFAYLVALTNSRNANERSLAQDSSIDAQLVHPLTLDALDQMLRQWCERVRGWRASAESPC